MAPVAAFFDLDRTILRGASGPVIGEALAEAGMRTRSLPGEALFYRGYDLYGETLLGMALARGAAFGVKGWVVERMEAAAEAAAPKLEQLVCRYARPLLEEHRRRGHQLVLATTTPEVLVKPLAAHLGFDDVIATRYASEGGRYLGRLESRFVWGAGKVASVREWADARKIDLRDCWAYSDSRYDVPLLMSVGHRFAVNPDPGLLAWATLRRWPILHLDVPPGVPTIVGVEPQQLLRLMVRPELFPYARFDLAGIERIPDSGPFILVSNHRSYFDVAPLALIVARKGRPTRFLGKAELFDAPVVGGIARGLGGIRVDRGGDAAASLVEAERVLQAGEGLVLLPQGTIPRGAAFFDPVLRGKTGAARLAAATGAPVVPVGLWNTEAVWPRSSRLPRITNLLSPPTVRARVGEPVAGLRRGAGDAAADTERIMAAVAALLPDEARARRTPTGEELARTYPAGHQGEERAVGVEPAG
jgi:putative phosphoserine phosphatase / 1-acylglycerol-3-phosphate O-acyltransferase